VGDTPQCGTKVYGLLKKKELGEQGPRECISKKEKGGWERRSETIFNLEQGRKLEFEREGRVASSQENKEI